jgi:hypothetical protein
MNEDVVSAELEKTFMSGWKNLWDHDATWQPIFSLNRYFIPVRNESGYLKTARSNNETRLDNNEDIKDFKKAWYNMLFQVWETSNTATSQGRPPRWFDAPLDKGMIFQLADPKTHSITFQEFAEAVQSLNKANQGKKFFAFRAGELIPTGWTKVSYGLLELFTL